MTKATTHVRQRSFRAFLDTSRIRNYFFFLVINEVSCEMTCLRELIIIPRHWPYAS